MEQGAVGGPRAWPEAALRALAYAALAGEFGLSAAFYLRARGRLVAMRKRLLAVGALFHVGLATPKPPLSVYPFSALMAPLFALAVLEEEEEGVGAPGFRDGTGALGALAAALLYRGEAAGAARVEYPPYCSWDLGLAWCLAAFGLLLRRAVHDRGKPSAPPGGQPRRAPAPPGGARVAAAVVVAVGAAPYVGLRTHPAFAMFSNLRLEGGASNHWLFTPRILRRIDLGGGAMADAVSVLRATSPAVASMQVDLGLWMADAPRAALDRANASAKFYISPPARAWPPPDWPPAPERVAAAAATFEPFGTTFLELRRRVANAVAADPRTPITVVYDRGGATRTFARAADGTLAPGSDPDLATPLPWLASLLFKFRAFDPDPAAPSPCRH